MTTTQTETDADLVGELTQVASGRAHYETPALQWHYEVAKRTPIAGRFGFSVPVDLWIARGKPLKVRLTATFIDDPE